LKPQQVAQIYQPVGDPSTPPVDPIRRAYENSDLIVIVRTGLNMAVPYFRSRQHGCVLSWYPASATPHN